MLNQIIWNDMKLDETVFQNRMKLESMNKNYVILNVTNLNYISHDNKLNKITWSVLDEMK